MQPANLGEVGDALLRIDREWKRAGDIIDRIHNLIKKAPPRKEPVNANEAIREVLELTHGETVKNGVSVHVELADGLPLVQGDRVQLQQVILNLIINAIEAMSGLADGARELLIKTGVSAPGTLLVMVQDTGPGLAATTPDRLFESFYTTKPSGLGMGLSICRSIVEAHDGRLWATANEPRGAVFQFTLPAANRDS
jgi:C4-dicarboxylate-specific signal transduction histidine kinase